MAWSAEQIESVASSAAAVTAAHPVATPSRWRDLGADERVLWGSFHGSGTEPYDTAVDHIGVGFRCTCPSRRVPCKHALALLIMWSREQVPPGVPVGETDRWAQHRAERASHHGDDEHDGHEPDATPATTDVDDDPPGRDDPPPVPDRDAARNERVEKMMEGLTELDRWLDDRIRTGLADPALARYSTWDDLAGRLVDAQAGSLANRIRRLAGLVGATPTWHDDVLAELGLLHLLSQAGRRLGTLPAPLADAVATTVGWHVRRADVLAGVPDTDRWVVAGRSDHREDRIEVRRHWLRGERSGRWALVLSFAAYQQSLDDSLVVGTAIHADLHRYPGPALRALVGTRHAEPAATIFREEADAGLPIGQPPGQTIEDASAEVGRMLVAEPWLDRVPTSVTAAVVHRRDHRTAGDTWSIGDHTGSLPILDRRGPTEAAPRGASSDVDPVTMLLALSGGRPVDLTIEWTPHGIVPLAVHLDGRTIDIGPRADSSFVGAA